MAHAAHRIRAWLACVATAAFIAAFGGVYAEMAMGHDPALGTGITPVVVTATATDDHKQEERPIHHGEQKPAAAS